MSEFMPVFSRKDLKKVKKAIIVFSAVTVVFGIMGVVFYRFRIAAHFLIFLVIIVSASTIVFVWSNMIKEEL